MVGWNGFCRQSRDLSRVNNQRALEASWIKVAGLNAEVGFKVVVFKFAPVLEMVFSVNFFLEEHFRDDGIYYVKTSDDFITKDWIIFFSQHCRITQ